MTLKPPSQAHAKSLEKVLGYLNFSSGASDAQFLANLNALFAQVAGDTETDSAQSAKSSGKTKTKTRKSKSASSFLKRMHVVLSNGLQQLDGSSPAFSDTSQSRAVLDLVFLEFPAKYLEFHRDVLFHQTEEDLFNALFVGRLIEKVLEQGPPWDQPDRIIKATRRAFDDYIGYRPVATLETQKLEPYENEWVRPVPIYVRDAGVVNGHQQAVVNLALQILKDADPRVLEAAHFDIDALEELAIDPRSYDFEHPVSRRPNYQFGQWDPRHIDGRGRYRRYVIQQVTMDALMSRCKSNDAPEEELQFEAAAVLAGTVLMGSGMSGWGPGCFDSSVTLESLMPIIASYRDAFYELLLHSVEGSHGDRLRDEAMQRRQPFGAARQHLNAHLANRRASQLQRVHLANVYARMGYPEAAKKQANIIPVASARMISRIDCRLTTGRQSVTQGDFETSLRLLDEIFDLLKRAIECGAVIDPWNILGFDANFSLFQALENSIRDHRADELVDLVEDIFAYCALVWSEAAARDNESACEQMESRMREIVEWWHKFAVHEVSSVEASDSREVFNAASNVVDALKLWHKGGAASSDVRFWASHSSLFESPRAYTLVIETLLERGDDVASMALLIHWLSQIENVPLEEAGSSFPNLARRWMHFLIAKSMSGYGGSKNADEKLDDDADDDAEDKSLEKSDDKSVDEIGNKISTEAWKRLVKFLDFVEANADSYWQVPDFEYRFESKNGSGNGNGHADEEFDLDAEELDDEEENPFSAAYQDVVYKDSTDDGMESEIFGNDSMTDTEIDEELRRLEERFLFLNMTSRLWVLVASVSTSVDGAEDYEEFQSSQLSTMDRWLKIVCLRREEWEKLLNRVQAHKLPSITTNPDSMANYDRQRWFKEHLTDRVIDCLVQNDESIRVLTAACMAIGGSDGGSDVRKQTGSARLEDDQALLVRMLSAILIGKPDRLKEHWADYLSLLRKCSVSYIPLARGGDSMSIARARIRQDEISHLLAVLPRLGLFVEASELIDMVRIMERLNPAGRGALTEFDELYQSGFEAIVEQMIRLTRSNRLKFESVAETESDSETESNASDENPSSESNENSDKVSASEDFSHNEGVDWRIPMAEIKGMSLTDPSDQISEELNSAEMLFHRLEQLTQPLLATWFEHSNTLQLSVLEKVTEEERWNDLVEFIKKFGGDLFTQGFFSLANIRAILHQGVEHWFDAIEEEGDEPFKLIRVLNEKNRRPMGRKLTLVLEAVIENFGEYRDYNSTTTQSDQGDMLYMLLDFLRLRMHYDRIAWRLNPLKWAHRVLVENNEDEAGKLWRQALADRMGPEARRHLRELKKLQTKYAMQMPTVSDRLKEKFVKPLQIDRIRALIPLAMNDMKHQRGNATFKLLEKEISVMARTPTGVGLEVPQWIVKLQDEVDRELASSRDDLDELDLWIKSHHTISDDQLDEQIEVIAERFNLPE